MMREIIVRYRNHLMVVEWAGTIEEFNAEARAGVKRIGAQNRYGHFDLHGRNYRIHATLIKSYGGGAETVSFDAPVAQEIGDYLTSLRRKPVDEPPPEVTEEAS